MHTRFLPIFFGVVFALTLFFVAVAGAQEERTDTEGVGAQAVEVQQQQVQNDQQQVVAVQQQVGVQAQGCRNPQTKAVISNRQHDEGDFEVTGGAIEIRYTLDTTTGLANDLFIEVMDKNGGVVRRLRLDQDTNGEQVVRARVDPGTFTFEIDREDNVNSYRVEFIDCRNTEPANNNNDGGGDGGGRSGGDGGGGGGGGGDGGGGGGTVGTSQTENTTDTNTTNTTTNTNPAAEVTAADANLNADLNRPNSGSFRCELFLRSVSDEQGALRAQYRGNEAIVQRFEQCLSENVLADTIPNRNLPFTGGMPLLLLAAIGLAAIVAGVSVVRAVTRRGR